MISITELITELGKLLNIENLSFDANGFCGIVFDEKKQVDLFRSSDDQEIHLNINLGYCPGSNRSALYRQLLLANDRAFDSIAFALDTELDQLLLWWVIPVNALTPQLLLDSIQYLRGRAELAEQEIAEWGSDL